jgi:hypothetical protein
MIDLENYRRAVQWLERTMSEQANQPDSKLLRDAMSHAFQVTYNVTERILREALVQLSDDPLIPGLNSGELMRFASDEGLYLSSPTAWLRYGLAIELEKESLGDSFPETTLPLLTQYLRELQGFASRLEGRLTRLAA